ncbi:hypothetical protein OWS73_06870 [Burkholderia sp. 1B3(2022)]|uniref:hypothetical protein n=1 Tax=Burkholderia sp. 1B3(2022) TaxID=2997425 RepID=UPI002FC5867D
MSGRLTGKRVLLTGGVANIGLAILESFVAEGATVSVVDIDEVKGRALESRFGDKVRFFEPTSRAKTRSRPSSRSRRNGCAASTRCV